MSLDLLVLGIQQLGRENAKGKFITKSVSCLITSAVPTSYEALVATLTATLTATRKKVIAFQGELVLQSVHNNVDIIRLQE